MSCIAVFSQKGFLEMPLRLTLNGISLFSEYIIDLSVLNSNIEDFWTSTLLLYMVIVRISYPPNNPVTTANVKYVLK